MATRVGIELTTSRCTILEAESGRRGPRIRAVRSISYSPTDPVGLIAALRQLLSSKTFSRHARVVIWGLRSGHQAMSLPPASQADLHDLALREARRTLPFVADGEVTSGILAAPGSRHDIKCDLSFVAASAPDIRSRLQPLASGGFEVDSVLTPPIALAAVARLRRTAPENVQAHVAVNRDAACLTIVRNGLVLFAREMPGADPSLDRSAFAARLGADLKRSFLFFSQTFKLDVAQVYLCGDFPGLRSLTAPLIQTLDLEVETLDTLVGFDAARPPMGDQVDDGLGELQLAWAAAVDAEMPVNLLPLEARERQEMRHVLRRLAVAGGLALLLVLLAWFGARTYGNSLNGRAQALRQELARLEPQIQAAGQARDEQALGAARRAALDAFATQGPRLARVLEVLGRSAPEGLFLTSISAAASGPAWRLSVTGRAFGSDAAAAQAAYNQFIHLATDSIYLGVPTRLPSMRTWAGDQTMMTLREPPAAQASSEQATGIQPQAARAMAESPGHYTNYPDSNRGIPGGSQYPREWANASWYHTSPEGGNWANPWSLQYEEDLRRMVRDTVSRPYGEYRAGPVPSRQREAVAEPGPPEPPKIQASFIDFVVEFEVKR